MTLIRWRPGSFRALAWENGFALLNEDVTLEAAEQLWQTVRQDSQLCSFLQTLMAATGQSLQTLPSFAVAIVSGDAAQVAVRGQFMVMVESHESSFSFTGEGVATWAESLVSPVAAIELSGSAATTNPSYPILGGVVEASCLHWATDRVSGQNNQAPDQRDAAQEITATGDTAGDEELKENAVSYEQLFNEEPEQLNFDPDSTYEVSPERVQALLADMELSVGQSRWQEITGSESVLAVFCRRGHPNPPQRTQCYLCAEEVAGQPRMAMRPQLGWLRVSGGETVPLDGVVIAGRNPKAEATDGGKKPRFIALPHRHISSNHLAFLVESWTVLVRDLGSSNGSYLRRHGKPPVRLPEHPVPLVSGDVIDLGHGVFINVERIP